MEGGRRASLQGARDVQVVESPDGSIRLLEPGQSRPRSRSLCRQRSRGRRCHSLELFWCAREWVAMPGPGVRSPSCS